MLRIAAAVLLSVCLGEASPIYRVVDLGTLEIGGASAATALNSRGEAVGWSTVGGGQWLQAMSSSGAPRSLSPAQASRATGINDAGQVVGVQYDAYGQAYAVEWMPDGDARALGSSADSYAMAINSRGLAAGAAGGEAVRFGAGGGGVEKVGVNAAWSSANAINPSGAVAGTAQLADGRFRAFAAGGTGGVTMLGTLGGGASYGQAINASGWVAGGSTTVQGYLHAFLYADGRMKDLGTLAAGTGAANSSAYGVNDWGQVVGYSQLASGGSSAFLWKNGQMLDLNELIAAETGWRLLEASAINNSGQIAGFGIFEGVQRAFRLDPAVQANARHDSQAYGVAAVPEPGAWTMILIGAAAVAFGVRGRAISRPAADPNEWTPPYR